MKRLYLILTLCSLAVILALAFAQDTKTGIVRGIARDTSPLQNPIEGVRVVVVNPAGIEHEALTDSSGEFEIIELPPGRYLMSFTKEGYEERVGKPITVVAGGDQYVSMKMSEETTFTTFLKRLFGGDDSTPSKTTEEEESGSQNQESGSLVWLLLLCLVIVVGVVIIGRRNRRRSE